MKTFKIAIQTSSKNFKRIIINAVDRESAINDALKLGMVISVHEIR